MKHIKKYNENSYSLSFEEFKSNLKEENSEINNLISKIPIGLLLKAKKDLEKLNINVIIKKIYNFIIGNKNESIENYILTLFGVHSLITLAKWLKDFCGKRLPKYFFMLFGLDEESVEKEEFEIITGFRALSKLVFGVAFVCCLIAKIIWISGGLSVDYTFKVEDKHHTDLVIKTYYGYDNNHIEDDYKQKFDLTSDGDILYKGNKIGYIKDDKLFNNKNNAIAIQQDKNLHDDYKTIDLYKLLTNKTNLKNLYDRELETFKAEEESHKKKIKELEARIKEVEDKKSKVVENVDQAKALLRNLDIETNNPDFLRIKDLLKSNLGYCGLFTKFFFKDKISYSRLESLYSKIKELGNKIEVLDKNIVEYDNFESLDDDISRIDDKIFQNKIFNMLPRKQKDLFNDYNQRVYSSGMGRSIMKPVKNPNKDNFMNSILGFRDNPELIKSFTNKISAYDNAEKIVDFANSLIDGSEKTYEKTLELCKKLKDVYIRFSDEEKQIIIVRVNSYSSIKKLASDTNWCITRDIDYYNRYTKDGRQQFILFDFKKPSYKQLSIIGITTQIDGYSLDTHIYAAHDKVDSSVRYDLQHSNNNFYEDLGITREELMKYIVNKPDSASERISNTLNKNKYISKFLDFY
jgi:hypothetical protein